MTLQNGKQTPKSILIEGAPEGRRFTLVIDGKRIAIPATSFRVFSILALIRYNDHIGGGWVYKSEIGVFGGNEAAYIHVARKNIECALGGKCQWIPIEHNGEGSWRIAAPSEVISFDLANLRNFPDHRLTRYLPTECHCTERIGQDAAPQGTDVRNRYGK